MKHPELLSPVGDYDCLVAAVQNGADAVYFGSSSFNARASATNFSLDSIEKAIDYAKLRGVKTHLTLNTLIKDNEFEEAIELANKIYSYGIDAIIVQDLGLAKYLIDNFPGLEVHASTQMTIHNLSGALEAQELGFNRVVLSREVPISEIKKIRQNCDIELEAFLHGALCISYSGQCLFSSMIGGRSGNRGKCAQACRLPYELLKDSKFIEKGYLLSPKDVSSLPILSDLIGSGIDSFKIEGRMKTPEYVATVTKTYRKYIDEILGSGKYSVSDEDTTNLMQVFNRGGFSTGHLEDKPNFNFIYKEKSNNQGIYLGKVLSYAPVTGHVKIKLEAPLDIGDTIFISSETGNYTISELMIKKQNFKHADIGEIVTVGRMKGRIIEDEKIYKMSSKLLSDSAKLTYSGKEIKKIPLKAKLDVSLSKPVTLSLSSMSGIYEGVDVSIVSDLIPEKAMSNPITKERLTEQISKTGNTPYEFTEIDINLEDDLYLPSIGKLNELRRNALETLEEKVRSTYKRKELDLKIEPIEIKHKDCNHNLSVLLYDISNDDDFSYLRNVNNVYIPYHCFIDNPDVAEKICNNNTVYLYMPNIIQNKLENTFKENIKDMFNKYTLKGAVISNLGQVQIFPKDIELIANYTLNTFNKHSANELSKLGITKFILSPELNRQDIQSLSSISNMLSEVYAYGNLPLMTMQYCPISHNNHCKENCPKMCKDGSYELKDRMGFKFRLKTDNIQTITTVYNSKTTFIESADLECDSVLVSFLDESKEDKEKIINTILEGKKIEGENYTNGNLARDV